MSNPTDHLRSRLAAGVDAAFPDLVRLLQDGVYSGALQLTRSHHDAEDATQETFVRAYRALAGYDADRIRAIELRPWVWTIALNVCRNRARAGRRRREQHIDDVSTVASDDPAADATATADLAVWRSRLSHLSASQRTGVVLRYVVDLSYAEIAEATGRREATIRSDVRRGLERLRTIIAEEGR
jgi:RNA polymerase sigma-70 factor (ECF subfamily)